MDNKSNKEKCVIKYQCPCSDYIIYLDCNAYFNNREDMLQTIIDRECNKKYMSSNNTNTSNHNDFDFFNKIF